MKYENYEIAIVDDVLSHRGPKSLLIPGRTYTIDNTSYAVESIRASDYVSGVTNVKLRKL